jgi:hypothetical protein
MDIFSLFSTGKFTAESITPRRRRWWRPKKHFG